MVIFVQSLEGKHIWNNVLKTCEVTWKPRYNDVFVSRIPLCLLHLTDLVFQ